MHFCWVCLGSWDTHGEATGGFYRCNRFEQGEVDPANEQRDEAAERTAHARYLHYYERALNHGMALRVGREQLRDHADGYTAREQDVLRELGRSRGVLRATYIRAFYMRPHSAPLRLLEDQQEQLEKYTELLTELIENPAEARDGHRLTTLCTVVQTFRTHLEEGDEDAISQGEAGNASATSVSSDIRE